MTQFPTLGDTLKIWLKGAECIVIVGIGNELRQDDFVGVQVVRKLKGKVPEHVKLIESETVPESYLDEIVEFNPTHILIIDAGALGCEPGTIKFIHYDAILKADSVVSTHSLPLRVFCDYLATTLGARIALLIIEPENTAFGEGLSEIIGDVASELIATLLHSLS
ncbi:MAG: hydrogenase 3 maturation endopeptidase HyCI [Candidatus Bathyarchaeota archaeon]|nr:MAG: hydrogenase 3 maturation endopeptidase HyCI [Candidatus Bathyarchaeota archaeon]